MKDGTVWQLPLSLAGPVMIVECGSCHPQAGAYPFSRPEDEALPAPQRMHVMLQVEAAAP